MPGTRDALDQAAGLPAGAALRAAGQELHRRHRWLVQARTLSGLDARTGVEARYAIAIVRWQAAFERSQPLWLRLASVALFALIIFWGVDDGQVWLVLVGAALLLAAAFSAAATSASGKVADRAMARFGVEAAPDVDAELRSSTRSRAAAVIALFAYYAVFFAIGMNLLNGRDALSLAAASSPGSCSPR